MTDEPRPTSPALRRPWFLAPALAAALVGVVAVALFFVLKPKPQTPAAAPLTGELTVGISSADHRKQGVAVNDPGALPVRAGEWMAIEASSSEPAYFYLLWFDSRGRVAPLYPWNNDKIEVEDVSTPPPARGAGQVVHSPMTIGTNSLKFGKHGGLETVLLLARRTPLPADVKLGELLGPLPPTPLRAPDEVVSLRFDRGQAEVSTLLDLNRGSKAEAGEADRPLLQWMEKLREHFEVVRALRFAHEGE